MKLNLLTLAALLITAVCGFGQVSPQIATATLQEAYISLPGNATAIYDSTGTLRYYQHTNGLGSTTFVSPSTPSYSATITEVAETAGNVVTITAPNSFVVGQVAQLSGLTNATWLNGQTPTILTAANTNFTFTDSSSHGVYVAHSDTGTSLVSYSTTSVGYAPFGEDFDNSCGGGCKNGMYDFVFSSMGQDDGTNGSASAGYGGMYGTPNRTFSAVQGRWLSPDPVVDGNNAYIYASNAPTVNSDPTGLQDGWDCDDDSCDVWLSWDWSDGGFYGWDGLDWGWSGDPSYLTPNLTGNSGGTWWVNQNNLSAAAFVASLATPSTYTFPTGEIKPVVYVGLEAAANLGVQDMCLKNCGSISNAGETAEQRSNRYLTIFMQAIGQVAGSFHGGLFEVQGAEVFSLEVETPFVHPDIIKTEAKFALIEKPLPPTEVEGFQQFKRSDPTPLGRYTWAKKAGLSPEQEAKYMAAEGDSWYHDFRIGEVRTSDHWGELGTSTYTLGLTDEQMIAMGGYKVPSEPNLWLFKKPVSGYVYYKDMIVKATGKPLWP
jgi:RHS repeat-associated protein